MARRRGNSASFGMPGRPALSSRSFDDSIHQLTAQSIEQSLREIEKVLQERYGQHTRRRKLEASTDER